MTRKCPVSGTDNFVTAHHTLFSLVHNLSSLVHTLKFRFLVSQAALQQHVQLTQYVEADHKAARREYLKHLMEQNKKVASHMSFYILVYHILPPLYVILCVPVRNVQTLSATILSVFSTLIIISILSQLISYREHVKTVEKKKEIEADNLRPDYHEVTWNRSTR